MFNLFAINFCFKIFAMNGTQIGKITKQWSGILREAFTDADHFGITFPIDLDVSMKAVLLGALFLIVSMVRQFIKLFVLL